MVTSEFNQSELKNGHKSSTFSQAINDKNTPAELTKICQTKIYTEIEDNREVNIHVYVFNFYCLTNIFWASWTFVFRNIRRLLSKIRSKKQQ